MLFFLLFFCDCRLFAVSTLFVFTWGVSVAEILALFVGYNAVQAMKCCCCPDRYHRGGHSWLRFCVFCSLARLAISVKTFGRAWTSLVVKVAGGFLCHVLFITLRDDDCDAYGAQLAKQVVYSKSETPVGSNKTSIPDMSSSRAWLVPFDVLEASRRSISIALTF